MGPEVNILVPGGAVEQEPLPFLWAGRSQQWTPGISEDMCEAGAIAVPFYMRENDTQGGLVAAPGRASTPLLGLED